MKSIPCILAGLQSFLNLYHAVMRQLSQSKETRQQLGEVIKLNELSIRNRLNQPTKWKVAEIKALAAHYSLPYPIGEKAERCLLQFQQLVDELDKKPRCRLLKLCQLTDLKLRSRARNDWTIEQIRQLSEGLRQYQ